MVEEGNGAPMGPVVPSPPPPEAWQRPVRLEPVAGTPYGLAILGAPEPTSGPSIGSLVSGVAALPVAVLVTCVALAGAGGGWGLWVGGAFAVLAAFLATTGIVLGLVAIRQLRRARPAAGSGRVPAVRGHGLAVAGAVCGGVALVVVFCSLGGGALIQLA